MLTLLIKINVIKVNICKSVGRNVFFLGLKIPKMVVKIILLIFV